MEKLLSVSKVKILLDNAIETFPHDECETCECFLGYVTQLTMESDESSRQLLDKFKSNREDIHSCLGCDPCPPGDHYAQYLLDNRKE